MKNAKTPSAYKKETTRENNVVITKEEILKTLAKDKPELQKRFKVHKIALFGSYSRGDLQADSDVDILVEVDPSIGLDFVTLAERIEKLLGVSVDLVSSRAVTWCAMHTLPSRFRFRRNSSSKHSAIFMNRSSVHK